ncbi:MAG: EamA family transporter [Candidatus Lokiarchaeota archaeon]|nr:EamA family transporter [Candidatus Lokiarchaeota archaeon]MBD3338021.1 EamA family transporter [Candidatus Lokiarchaeota archaeon]
MEQENVKKGFFFGIIGTILGGFNPIIANSRPCVIDAYLFSAMTVVVQAIIFFPLMLIESKRIKSNFAHDLISSEEMERHLYGYKKNIPLIIFLGLSFGFCFVLFFLGYQLAGAINGTLVLKTTIFFSILFDWIILRKKLSLTQLIFSFVLFFGLFLAVTQGSFNIIELNIGVVIMLLVSAIWMFSHALSKPMLDREEISSLKLVCIRNFISAIFLFSTYFIFYPLENMNLLINPINLFWGLLMGGIYGFGLYLWYKSMQNISVSKATIIVSGNLIVTAIFATLVLGEIFSYYHLIGTILVITSIVIIVNPFKK